MGKYKQTDRPLAVQTGIGTDALVLEKLSGREAISELFHFQLDMLAEVGTTVSFEKLLGRDVNVVLRSAAGQPLRYFAGIVSRFSQGPQARGKDGRETFIRYQAEMVPRFWLLTRKAQSRIFQQLSVPAILKQVLKDEWQLDVALNQLSANYDPRDYVVQYRETDFAFVSRLMEEEGIFYSFTHGEKGNTLVLADTPRAHTDTPGASTEIYDDTSRSLSDPNRVRDWVKSQEVRSGKVTLWDHCFELPGQHLQGQVGIGGRKVEVGRVSHDLAAAGNQAFELYDYPGGYAKRFDGIAPGGGEQADDLKKIFTENDRTAHIRLDQETLPALRITGTGNCGQFVAGCKFQLTRHFDGDGSYILTEVNHTASIEGTYTTGEPVPLVYQNEFRCIPAALPFRPHQVTPKPRFEGTQTATVVGPKDEEIHCDRYGRVKVQFNWDRQGKLDENSSCWIRVMQATAGGGWGMLHLPRVGHEVVVAFVDGDLDQPIILGSVYNAAQMPPFTLPDERTRSCFKSNTVNRDSSANFSGLAFDDRKGAQTAHFHSEKDMEINAEHDKLVHVGNHHHIQVGCSYLRTVGGLPSSGGGSGGGGGLPSEPGSGQGGGLGDVVAATGSFVTSTYSNPLPEWTVPNTGLTLGSSSTNTVGWNFTQILGMYSTLILGWSNTTVINPAGYLGGVSCAPLQAIGSTLGSLSLTYGANTSIVYGPSLSIAHGPQVSITTDSVMETSGATKALAILNGLATSAYLVGFPFIPQAGVDQNPNSADVFQAEFDGFELIMQAGLVWAELADYARKQAVAAAAQAVAEGELAAGLTVVSPALGGAAATSIADVATAMTTALASQKVKTPTGSPTDDCHVNLVDGAQLTVARHIHLMSAPIKTGVATGDSIIFINAAGDGTNGFALVNGTKAASVTAGPAVLALQNQGPFEGNVQMNCGSAGTISLQCGPKGLLGLIEIDGDGITVNSKTNITLKVGASKIEITPASILLETLIHGTKTKVGYQVETVLSTMKAQIAQIQKTLEEHQ